MPGKTKGTSKKRKSGSKFSFLICLFFISILLIIYRHRCSLSMTAHQHNENVFKCLEGKCECDIDDWVIHCQNQGLEQIPMPESKLRGFEVIVFTGNNIKMLPSEILLLEKFPDLKGVVVEGNSNFDCFALDQYLKITVRSDCSKS